MTCITLIINSTDFNLRKLSDFICLSNTKKYKFVFRSLGIDSKKVTMNLLNENFDEETVTFVKTSLHLTFTYWRRAGNSLLVLPGADTKLETKILI